MAKCKRCGKQDCECDLNRVQVQYDLDAFLAMRMAEMEELHKGDKRTPEKWDEQPCLCGKSTGWCGRDSHRPDFAVDECNGTIFFDKDGRVVP